MIANPGKCRLLMYVSWSATIKKGEHTVSNSYYEKFLGANIDSQLDFKIHLETIVKKGSQKVNVLARMTRYMCISKKMLLMNTFLKAQFSYCPLV